MAVQALSPRALHAQRMVIELVTSDVTTAVRSSDSELVTWARHLGVDHSRFATLSLPPSDQTHPAITVTMDACINCTRCLRACRDVQVNDVIGLAFRGDKSQIVFDLSDTMGGSSCAGVANVFKLVRPVH